MNENKAYALVAVAAAFVAGILAYGILPEKSVTHWNAYGEPDGYSGRAFSAFFVPVLMVALYGLFWLLPRIDPFAANYRMHEREYDGFVAALSAFLLFVFLATIAYNAGAKFHMGQAIALGIAGLFWFLGGIMPRIRRNFFFGIRTPWTIMSDRVWRKTHEVGGLTFKLNAVIILVALPFPQLFLPIILVSVLLNALGLAAYSFLEFKKTHKYKPR